ncbi:MAG: proline racemase family protein [Chloroflexota bacterium]|nr:proline racemase family protein [Chloroflexota bacterium]
MDAARADAAGWFPVAHRWTEDWQGQTLSVVFESRGAPAERSVHAGTSPHAAPTSLAAPSSAARAHATTTMQAIDLHCAGEPLRLIRSGFPPVPFAPILERRRWAQEHADDARRVAMHEPRGHRDMYGAILLPPFRADADVAVLFMHNEGFSTMCGHGIIAITTALIEERLSPVTLPETTIRFETPAGLVTARAHVRAADGSGPEVERVRFDNVPSYLAARDVGVRPEGMDLPERKVLRVDIAFGGAYYGIVEASDLGLRVTSAEIERLTRAGAAITEVLRRDHRPAHPTDADLSFVYGTVIVDREAAREGASEGTQIRNVTVFADAEVDRSPCGSGTSALLAQAWARGRMADGDQLTNASITGESFIGRVGGRTWIGQQEAVETSIEGRAFVTGYPSLLVDDRDPLGKGFLLG